MAQAATLPVLEGRRPLGRLGQPLGEASPGLRLQMGILRLGRAGASPAQHSQAPVVLSLTFWLQGMGTKSCLCYEFKDNDHVGAASRFIGSAPLLVAVGQVMSVAWAYVRISLGRAPSPPGMQGVPM